MDDYTKLERGLVLEITDRDEFVEYVKENAHDPGVQMENWGVDMAPKKILIAAYQPDNEHPEESYYRAYDIHLNDTASYNAWSCNLIEDLIEEDLVVGKGHNMPRLRNLEDD